MNNVKTWILRILKDNGYSDIVQDQPLFAQIDSFAVVEFLLACDEKYSCLGVMSNSGLSKFTVDEFVQLILQSKA